MPKSGWFLDAQYAAQTCGVIESELKDEPARARPGASVQQPSARKFASAPVTDGAAAVVTILVADGVKDIDEVVGRVDEIEEVVGETAVLVLNLEEVEDDEGVAEVLPPAALA